MYKYSYLILFDIPRKFHEYLTSHISTVADRNIILTKEQYLTMGSYSYSCSFKQQYQECDQEFGALSFHHRKTKKRVDKYLLHLTMSCYVSKNVELKFYWNIYRK